jgi:acetolactate synthase-1/2/3 large subunit
VPDDAVVVADMCIPGYWLAGLDRVPAPRRLQYPMGWGTLGYAFPAALGARCTDAGPVVSSQATAASCSPAASWRRRPRRACR